MRKIETVRLHEECLGEAIDAAAERWGDAIGWVFEDRAVSFAEMRAGTDAAALALIADGVEEGDVVALWMPNRLEFAQVQFACAKIGAIAVAINTRFRDFEVAHMLRECEATVVVMVERFLKHDYVALLDEIGANPADPAAGQFPRLRTIVSISDDPDPRLTAWANFLAGQAAVSADALEQRTRRRRHDEPILIQYTSGTTAAPKGALLNHRYVLNVGNELFANMGVGEGDPVLNTQPFYHIGGSCGALPTPLTLGCRMVIPEFYDAERVMQLIERERCIARTGFAAMYIMEMAHPSFGTYDLSSVQSGWCSGTQEMLEKVREAMGIPGLMLTYSSTEVGGTASRATDSWEQRSTSAGRPLVGTELKIIDPETGETLPPETQGEILMRGWWQMNGYLKQPEQTAKALDAEGWSHTGDRGFVDKQGCLHFVGRYKDMLKVGGENVSAEEVEGFLLTHSAIKQVAVIGVPDARLDEVPMAIVELAEGESLSAEDLIAYCASRMANFRVPRHVRFITDWPMTGSGKIMKPKLREEYAAEMAL
ncbi:long-chain fatty acid--CoA ligase [Sphingomonas panacis]|uniref:3-methylmercaptopropionyl-CoA ligase n=1 Tax=Sphingomonas panacis TaxID=1560345 RepID=A0A1B3Z612_9SPHN|nr:AMP-binding protein [Sphingomonas panacis]AOH82867.1 long-chain fatty acid--CoA ligase [Sphingomonas panacis]